MQKLHFKLNKHSGPRIFFTSDPHFGHKNVLTFCERPFADLSAMHESLIANWNSVVTNDDTVFLLGDVFWTHNKTFMKHVYAQLNGRIYLIFGNHDLVEAYKAGFPNVTILHDIVMIWIDLYDPVQDTSTMYQIQLCHFPLMTWPQRIHHNCMHLHGHIHSMLVGNFTGMDSALPRWPNQYDVGVDNNNYTPIEFQEVLKKLNLLPESSMRQLVNEVVTRNDSE